MTSSTRRYSVWLSPTPDTPNYTAWEARITAACRASPPNASSAGSSPPPVFPPHVTLLSQSLPAGNASDSLMRSKFRILVRRLRAGFNLDVDVSSSTRPDAFYWQCVFARMTFSDKLREVRAHAESVLLDHHHCDDADNPEDLPYQPHLSLAYGDYSLTQREAIMHALEDAHAPECPKHVAVGTLQLVDTTDKDYTKWRYLATNELGVKPPLHSSQSSSSPSPSPSPSPSSPPASRPRASARASRESVKSASSSLPIGAFFTVAVMVGMLAVFYQAYLGPQAHGDVASLVPFARELRVLANVASCYDVLGVSPTASGKEIKRAFRRLSVQPLRGPRSPPTRSDDEYKTISDCADVLLSDTKRQRYDVLLSHGQRRYVGSESQWRLFTSDRARFEADILPQLVQQ